MPFHWYYLQFHSRVGSAARLLKAFPASQSMWKAWAHPLWLGGEVWFRHYCHSRVWRLLVCVYKNWLRKFTPMLSTVQCGFSCFLCSFALRAGSFFWTPFARLALGQLLSVSAGGFRDSKERSLCWKKREGSSRGSANTPVFSSTSTVLQHSKEKGFPYSLSCSFCSAFGGRNVGGKGAGCFVYHALGCMQAFYSILF